MKELKMQKQAIVHASQTQKIQVQQKVDKAQDNDSSAKVFYAVIGLILLGIVVGLPVYSSVTKMNSNSSGTSETIDKEPIEDEIDNNENENQDEVPEIVEQEQQNNENNNQVEETINNQDINQVNIESELT